MSENLNMIPLQTRPNRVTTSSHTSNTYMIKLWEDIVEPEHYMEELDIINSCSEYDTVVLDISTAGGSGETAALFNRALRNCNGHTVAIIGPSCASAGSIIALSCREWVLDDTSELMCHTATWGMVAKDTDIFEHANFSRKQLRRLFESVYLGFLTPQELDDLIKGTPFYFDAEELEERLQNLTEYRNEQEMKGCGNPDCTECAEALDNDDDPKLDLFGMIEQAVRNVLNERSATENVVNISVDGDIEIAGKLLTEEGTEKPNRRPRSNKTVG